VVDPQLLGRLHMYKKGPDGEHAATARLILPVGNRLAVLAFTNAGRVALLHWEEAGQQAGTMGKFLLYGMCVRRKMTEVTLGIE